MNGYDVCTNKRFAAQAKFPLLHSDRINATDSTTRNWFQIAYAQVSAQSVMQLVIVSFDVCYRQHTFLQLVGISLRLQCTLRIFFI